MTTVLLAVGFIAVIMLAMAVGVILRGKCLSGSCGGPKVTAANGELICGACGRTEKPKPQQIDFSAKKR